MNCPKCKVKMPEKEAKVAGVSYNYFRCAKCREELVHMKQLQAVAQSFSDREVPGWSR